MLFNERILYVVGELSACQEMAEARRCVVSREGKVGMHVVSESYTYLLCQEDLRIHAAS